jgi:DNA-binding transcriptional LysR family regulator
VLNLTIRQLETFRQVMLSGSISEAARTLGRTQPAVSAMLTGLERDLGFELFKRERKRLIPKPEAHYFLEEAEHVLSRLAQSARTMHEIGNLQKGRLRIACNPASSGFIVPRAVARFLRGRDDVKVSLMMRSSIIIEEWIASQQYDIGVAETPATPRRTVDILPFDLDCVCALQADDPLAENAVISPQDLDGRPMAVLFEDHPTLKATRQRFFEANSSIIERFELRTFLPALELVEQGLCSCICDPVTARSYDYYRTVETRLVFRPFSPPVPYLISLLTPAHRPMSELAKAFFLILAEELTAIEDRFR